MKKKTLWACGKHVRNVVISIHFDAPAVTRKHQASKRRVKKYMQSIGEW